jgi:GT2 family glycosyltransferase
VSQRSPSAPLVSVVTPLYNCLGHTQVMLATLRESMPRGLPYEVIFVDDGSTDGTREWLAGLGAAVRAVLNDRNLGFGAATNRGASQARGTILALLNNDLILSPGWLGPMLRTLGSLGERAGLVGNIQLNALTHAVDHAGIYFNRKFKPEHDRREPGRVRSVLLPVRRVAAVTGACVLVRREPWRALGGFDEAYVNGCEDIDLCFRAQDAGLVNAVALRSRVLHHVSASPGRKLRDEENTRLLFERWHGRIGEFAVRRWAWRHYRALRGADPRDIPDAARACRIALYLAGAPVTPPPRVLAAASESIDREFARWRRMRAD